MNSSDGGNPSKFSAPSDEPLYNIGIVSRMTGIPVATLRVWERRYNFPKSTRTPGGHRVWSEKEVIRLRWVKARVDEGMQTGQAVRALQHLEQEGRFPEIFALKPGSQRSMPDPSLANFHRRLRDLLLDHKLQEADTMLGEILALYPLEDLILEVIGPTMHDIGEAWLNGDVSIASEHLATNFLRQHLLMWMLTGALPFTAVQPILLACAPEELHEGSLLIMGVLLRRRGWPVAYLGQNVPLKDLDILAHQIRTPAIIFAAMTEPSARALANWPLDMPEIAELGYPLVGYGGEIFNTQPKWREKVPGVFLGENLREGVTRLDELLRDIVRPTI
jgi:DNA-binding transcriptional MerR regulator